MSKNAFKDGELERDDNNVHFLHVNGVKKPVPFYSLDVIISVGYRVHSKRGTAFRIYLLICDLCFLTNYSGFFFGILLAYS